MFLYFLNSSNKYRLLNNKIKNEDDPEIGKEIRRFLKEHNYTSYYTRCWKNGEGDTVYDVGSWSEFFILSELEKKNEVI